ncbi:S-adenosylmethionine decarboxylase [Durotheca rogersii]|uniref:S-adenosylmethionine decarboxylase n=1 Tax=Durotheca rogersii TaxID=419775 RepID=UPI00221E5DFB|nr:S-adenosylmethionine decarboxylase [Durotheca rogersii]KAI5862961.1 S-adenosylmethionine decarboxylase [Durotheca rogersii]
MINLDVPTNYTFSPSEGTPHLTINHDVAADLDSTNAFEGPEKLLEVWFAPSPKALPPGVKQDGLKSVCSDAWVGMLDMVNCKILSVLESEDVDAYLLSESSMFVFPHKLILKTCGTTTLLLGLHRLLRIAAEHAGFPFHNAKSLGDVRAAASPYRVFYSRKNFLFPHKQHGPHRSWKQEVKYLDDMFEGGSAYMVGKMNGDHWYLYITSPARTLTPPLTPNTEKTSARFPSVSKIPTGLAPAYHDGFGVNDETLEILMTDLDPENAKQFYLEHASAVASTRFSEQARAARQAVAESFGDLSSSTGTIKTMSTAESASDDTFDVFSNGSDSDLHDNHTPPSEQADMEYLTTEGHALGTVVSEECGLSDVYPASEYPDARIDAYLFTPCGFSANGIIPATQAPGSDEGAKPAHYFTVHVTPEPVCSFASFETNVPGGQNGRETSEIIEHVVQIFKPGRFSVTLFETKTALPHSDYGVSDRVGRVKRTDIPGYRRVDRILHDFDDYELVFRFYEREDWAGGSSPRVGEEM